MSKTNSETVFFHLKKDPSRSLGLTQTKPAAFGGFSDLPAESANLVVLFQTEPDGCFDVGNGKGPWVDDWTKWVAF